MPCPSRGRRGTCRTGPETAFDVGDDEAGEGDAHARYGQRPEGRRRDDAPPGYAGGRARHADARRCDARPIRGAGDGARRPNAPAHIGPDVGRGARPARPSGLKTISVSPCHRALRVDGPEGAHGAGRRGRRPLPSFRPGARGVRSTVGPARNVPAPPSARGVRTPPTHVGPDGGRGRRPRRPASCAWRPNAVRAAVVQRGPFQRHAPRAARVHCAPGPQKTAEASQKKLKTYN